MPQKHELLHYSLSAAAFLLYNDDLHSQIIYTDIEPDSLFHFDLISIDEYLSREWPIDLNLDGKLDFNLVISSSDVSGGSSGWFSIDVIIQPEDMNAVMNYYYSLRYGAAVIEEDRLISEYKNWNTANVRLMAFSTGSTSGGSSYGAVFRNLNGYWHGEKDKFLGLRFQDIDGQTHFGWMRLTLMWGQPDFFLQIKDFAYEESANTEIRTPCIDGCPPVEPDIHIYSDGSNIYIHLNETKGDNSFRIFNAEGQMVFQSVIDKKQYIFYSNFPPGVYFVNVRQDETEKTVAVGLMR